MDIYRYTNELLKYMTEKVLKKIEKSLLYSAKPIAIVGGLHRQAHRINNANAVNRADKNLTKRTAKFAKQLQNELVYRICLKFLFDFCLVNQCFKFNTKCILRLKTDMQKLFETNVNQVDGAALPSAVSFLMHPIFNISSFNWMTVSKYTLKEPYNRNMYLGLE